MVRRMPIAAGLMLGVAHLASAASALVTPRGAYICTVEQTAGIGAEMMEGADPPKAFIGEGTARFRIVVSRPSKGGKVRVEGRPSGTASATVLRGVFLGDGWRFTAAKDQAFLRLDFIGEAGWLWFYHAGFEKPDVDHLNLTVRQGHCEPAA